jgi:hypothetical protein
MINGRLKEFLIHPAFTALILTAVVILLIPPLFSKYRIKHIEDEYAPHNTMFLYSDLDSDGNSEKISFDLNDAAQTKIIVSRDNKILDQYDLKYQPKGYALAFIDDYNLDKYKECYVITMSHDSIFLNIIDPVKSRRIILADRFIDFRRTAQKSTDTPEFYPIGMVESDSGNTKDFVFYINSGYSLQPRNVYRYSIAEDSLLKSPRSGAVILTCNLYDINDDSQPEILLDIMATGNIDEPFPFSDQYSWLMVMDKNLKFLFTPIPFHENPSKLKVRPYIIEDRTQLLVFADYYGTEDFNSALCLFDIHGHRIKEKTIDYAESIYSQIFINENSGKQTFFFLKNRDAEIDEMDSAFMVINTITIPAIESSNPISMLDADGDGNKEYIFPGRGDRALVFTQSNFRNPVSYKFDNILPYNPLISQVINKGHKPLLYIQFPDMGYFLQYDRNPFYYLKYPFYGAVYLAILIFILLISRIQQYRLNQKQVTEKKMAALQMKAIKNQIDPHFTLNILNAIGSLYATEENREKADYIFGKYARLIRQTVVSSDQITITLHEELDFIKNYIELEQFRSGYSFDYTIDIDEAIDRGTKIPRMLIYTFVENAIKYGVRKKAEGGLLKISIFKNGDKCQIIVEDNGPGLRSDEKSPSGTGKGLTILNELIELYYRLEKSKITYTVQNIQGQGNRVEGTRTVVELAG